MEYILYEKNENIATITLNRPETLNSVSSVMIEELLQALKTANDDLDILCVILTGAGEKAFSAGGDIKEERNITAEQAYKFSDMGHQVCRTLQKLRIPVIAAVNGYALGAGMEFAIASDMIVAVETAKFGLPSVKLGIVAGFGGTQNITRIVGFARAKEIMMTGRMVPADEALALGIIQRVAPKETFKDEVMALAKEIASMPPYAVRSIKEVVRVGIEMDLESAYQVETRYAAPCYGTEDKYEAMDAFIEKRKPGKFINR